MTFPLAPDYSKGLINRAGQTPTTEKPGSAKYEEALRVVNDWRTCHAYPINTFISTLRKKVSHYENPIVAQRLKRLPTIIDKLNRYPTMKLSRMQDIGGVRGVVNTIAEVRELQAQYQDTKRFTHKLAHEHTLSGSPLATAYKGLFVELQLRTELQHTWSTAVETMGTFRSEALKSQQGSTDWLDFFALVSSAFAITEKTAPVPRFAHLTPYETFAAIEKFETKLNVLQQLRGLSATANAIHTGNVGGYYNLIILNTDDRLVQIVSYKKDELARATKDYAMYEARAVQGESLELVLVSAGRLSSLKKAYPNYFLNVRDFAEKVQVIIDQVRN